ncbi:hypothetical protein [uncultured Gimesia sp.]|uniref:hypothetical protein n=1 Tax=uncultured Gimesia sp. TaxID=1678688 RepID=UPI0030DD5F8A|tara:strand:- start:38283 stop:38645 length:363 start_codon:yes stop_codon:yes gene_type:complete
MDTSGWIAGELAEWPTKSEMAQILDEAGLDVSVGLYSIQVLLSGNACFAFEEYGGDLGDPVINADADSAEELLREARLVSDALMRAKLRHRFEIYSHGPDLLGYLHFDWPLKGERANDSR